MRLPYIPQKLQGKVEVRLDHRYSVAVRWLVYVKGVTETRLVSVWQDENNHWKVFGGYGAFMSETIKNHGQVWHAIIRHANNQNAETLYKL